MKLKSKKGEFFLIDGLFSIVILAIGFLIISSNQPKQTNDIPLSILAENTMELFSSVKIDELCDACDCSNKKLSEYCLSNYIINKNQTILDSVGEMYSRGTNNYKQRAGQLFKNITLEKNMIREEIYGMELIINGESIYLQGSNQQKAKEMISSKKIIFGVYEFPATGQVVYWGPYLAEVKIWQE
jgi:hypothetical protein